MSARQRPGDHSPTALQLVRIPSIVTLACGMWLVAAPFVVGQDTDIGQVAGFWNEILVGVAVVVVSVVRQAAPLATSPFALLLVTLAVWLIVSPFAFGYRTQEGWPALMTSDVVTGTVLLVVSLGAWTAGRWMAVRVRSGRYPDRAADIPD